MGFAGNEVIVLYRNGNSQSQQFAAYYCAAHHLESSQMVSVPCSGNEIVSDYATWQTEFNESVLAAYCVSHGVKVIVVGYGVPGGFHDGDYIISSTSRLSRIGQTYSRNTINPLYNRQGNGTLQSGDYATYKIVSRIDAPTLDEAKAVVDRAVSVMRQGEVNGMFFLDAFPVIYSENSSKYAVDLHDFTTNTLSKLNLASFQTVNDTGRDAVIPRALSDSFIWACNADRATDSFFKATASARVFLYNADTDNAATLRDATSTRWPHLALRNGYIATAGSMSFATNGEDHYLRPRPYFDAMLQTATVAEAYLFAVPYVDCPETMLGDPLVSVSFPMTTLESVTIPTELGTDVMIDQVSQAAASLYDKKRLAQAIKAITDGWGSDTITAANAALITSLQTSYADDLANLDTALPLMVSTAGSRTSSIDAFATYLTNRSLKVGRLYMDGLASNDQILNGSYALPQGTWRGEFTMADQLNGVAGTYQFKITVATDHEMTDVVATILSASSQVGWSYEKDQGSFAAFPAAGLPLAYAGRLIRYIPDVVASPSLALTRGRVYYVKYSHIVGGNTYDAAVQELGVYS